jgi:hypothetical protein
VALDLALALLLDLVGHGALGLMDLVLTGTDLVLMVLVLMVMDTDVEDISPAIQRPAAHSPRAHDSETKRAPM